MKYIATIFLCCFCFLQAHAVIEPEERLADPELEARARALSAEIRCVVCPFQSIDASEAGMAEDLRMAIRERLLLGDSDAEVKDYLSGLYGDEILMRPRRSLWNSVLWFSPLILLMLGGFLGWHYHRQATALAPGSPEADKRLQALNARDE